jgi:hypothetical protein
VSAFTHGVWQIAGLEGCLVEYKASPQACVEGVAEWYELIIYVVVAEI